MRLHARCALFSRTELFIKTPARILKNVYRNPAFSGGLDIGQRAHAIGGGAEPRVEGRDGGLAARGGLPIAQNYHCPFPLSKTFLTRLTETQNAQMCISLSISLQFQMVELIPHAENSRYIITRVARPL